MTMKPYPMLLALVCLGLTFSSRAQNTLRFDSARWMTNGDLSLRLVSAASPYLALERSTNLVTWEPLAMLKSAATNDYADSGTAYRGQAYYRGVEVTGTNVLTGDQLGAEAGAITLHPINHASFVMSWNGKYIYNDPVGGASPYNGIPRADLILVSHV